MVDWILSYPFPLWIGGAAIIGGIVRLLVKIELLSSGFLQHLKKCEKKDDILDRVTRNQVEIATTLKHIQEVTKKHDEHLFK